MIVLHQFPAMLGLPNPSPFCLKLETWLRLAGLEYTVKVPTATLGAPLGKLPYIDDDGARIADSSSIIEHLARTRGVTLDAGLGAAQRAQAHAFAKLLEEHTYWAILHSRWIAPAGWAVLKTPFFGALPPVARSGIARFVRAKVRRDALGHGLARHAPEEILRRAKQDLDAIAAQLGDGPYFFGEAPTTIDATLYGFLAQCWEARLETPLRELVGAHPNLVAHCARMRARCFPELPPLAAA